MSAKAELELEASCLEPGESVRMRCPFCGGGDAKQNCLSLTHADDGALLFHCYRAACGAAGRLGGSTANLIRKRPERRNTTPLPNIEERLTDVGESMPHTWCPGTADEGTAWGLSVNDLRRNAVGWDPNTSRFAMPIMRPNYTLRGRVLRVPPWSGATPKVLTLPYVDEPLLSWNRRHGDGTVIVVEDIPSSLRLAEIGERAVALNGTHLTDDAKDELIAGATNLVWALDRDAIAKAQKYDAELRLHFRHTVVLLLERDIKDMGNEEINTCLSGIYWRAS